MHLEHFGRGVARDEREAEAQRWEGPVSGHGARAEAKGTDHEEVTPSGPNWRCGSLCFHSAQSLTSLAPSVHLCLLQN